MLRQDRVSGKKEKIPNEIIDEALKMWRETRNYHLTASKVSEKFKEQLKGRPIYESYVRRWVELHITASEFTALKKLKKSLKSRECLYPRMEELLLKWFEE